jgi:hypothetical protein
VNVGKEGRVSVDKDVAVRDNVIVGGKVGVKVSVDVGTEVGCVNEEVEFGDATGVHDTRNKKRTETISSFVFTFHLIFRRAAQRFGSPVAALNKTRTHKTNFSSKWPPQAHAEGGQVEPVLGGCNLMDLGSSPIEVYY